MKIYSRRHRFILMELFLITASSAIICCTVNDNNPKVDMEKIPGRYTGRIWWYKDLTAPLGSGEFMVQLDATVSKMTNYYSVQFDDNDTIHLPTLKLKVDNPVYSDDIVAYVHLIDNSQFTLWRTASPLDNAFSIDRGFDLLCPGYSSISHLELTLRSNDPDSIYFLEYIGCK
jgi:hypothetical protein